MTNASRTGLLAIDVGTSRMKLAWYSPGKESLEELPTPDDFLELQSTADAELLSQWTNNLPLAGATCLLASVHRETTQWLTNELAARGLATIQELLHNDLPLTIHTTHPDQTGIDRLLNAVAANRLRQPDRPAIIVDMGTAITVDLVSADGAFDGGGILPGIHLSARALQTGTDVLPLVELDESQSPPEALGKSTEAAIAAGLYWGAVGAVRELIDRLSARCETVPELFITGGDGSQIAASLSGKVGVRGQGSGDRGTPVDCSLPTAPCSLSPFLHPHMVLAGIQITAQELS